MRLIPSKYSIIIPQDTLLRADKYLHELQLDRTLPGKRLQPLIQDEELKQFQSSDLLGKLFDTKIPQIFAESEVVGDGSDWNLTELRLLGDISVAVPVTMYDNGKHHHPIQHQPPFSGMLVFTPGALLCNGQGLIPPDLKEVTSGDGQISAEDYYNLYKRRLLPVLEFINEHATERRSAFITIPGLGCGQFAGDFHGQLGHELQKVFIRLLHDHGSDFQNIKGVYYDPYNECLNERYEIHGISFMVRPLTASGNSQKSQLSRPESFAEADDDFSNCSLYSVVAWDHVSWPGNDFYIGSRMTDDGVKAAATNSMSVLTQVEGVYDSYLNKYQPPKPFSTWRDVVDRKLSEGKLRLWNLELVHKSI